jgi:hypothetical protein
MEEEEIVNLREVGGAVRKHLLFVGEKVLKTLFETVRYID